MPVNCGPAGDKPIVETIPPKDHDINAPVGGLNPNLPVNPPFEGPGPTDPGTTFDESPPNYAGMYPRQNGDRFAEFCRIVPTLRMVNGIILNILYNHFADPKNIIDPALRQFVWSPVKADSKLVINVEADWDPSIIGQKPAIFLDRLEYDFEKIAIGDRIQQTRHDGIMEFMCNVVGQHVLKCYSDNSSPADALAFEVGTLMLRVSPWIAWQLNLTRFRPGKTTAKVRDDRAAQDTFYSAIPLNWAFDYRWKIKYNAPMINFIDIQAFGFGSQ